MLIMLILAYLFIHILNIRNKTYLRSINELDFIDK